jgi:hypothetical protein
VFERLEPMPGFVLGVCSLLLKRATRRDPLVDRLGCQPVDAVQRLFTDRHIFEQFNGSRSPLVAVSLAQALAEPVRLLKFGSARLGRGAPKRKAACLVGR